MKFIKVLLFATILLLLLPVVVFGNTKWQTLKTEHFTIFYPGGRESEAWQVLQSLEYYRPQVEKLCGNEVLHFPVVIEDVGTLANGFTDPVNNRIHLFTYPPIGSGELSVENWWAEVGVHEYTHELSLAKTTGVARQMQWWFGNLLLPNNFTPGWIVEGITVYSESQLDPFQGRLNNGLFDAYIGARIADDRWPTILDATYSPLEFQLSGIYTYGSEFSNYLTKTYGEEKFAQFFAENGAYPVPPIIPALGIDRSARKIYGKSFPELWQDWEKYERERLRDYKMDGDPVTYNGWNTLAPVLYGNKLYYLKVYPQKTGAFQYFNFKEIVERDLSNNQERILLSVPAGFSIPAIKIRNGKLYYASNWMKIGYDNSTMHGLGFISALHQFDLLTRRDQTLFAEGIRSFEILEDGRIIYAIDRKNAFGSVLFSYEPGTKTKKQLLESEFLIDEMNCDKGRTVVTARRDWANDSIYLLNLEKQEFTALVDTPYIEGGVSLEGERLFFQANYNRIWSIYCYDFVTAKIYRVTENGCAIDPVYNEFDNQLYYIGLNSYGFDIYHKTLVLYEFALPSELPTVSPNFTLKETEVSQGGYGDNLRTLAPKMWAPIVDFNESHNEIGGLIAGRDAIGDFSYSATITYDSKQEKTYSTGMVALNCFNPVQTMIIFDNHDENIFKTTFGLGPVGCSFIYNDDYQGAVIEPYVMGGFGPVTLKITTPSGKTKKDNERNGFYADLAIRQYLPGSELDLKGSYIYDPDHPSNVFKKIRGYDNELTAKQGQMISFDYCRPLFKIHNGFWNPNIYFEDLTATLFADQAIPDIGDRQFSWGVEFHLETKTFNWLPIDWGTRLVRNINGDNKIELFGQTILPRNM